jgi:hypothetical protein
MVSGDIRNGVRYEMADVELCEGRDEDASACIRRDQAFVLAPVLS